MNRKPRTCIMKISNLVLTLGFILGLLCCGCGEKDEGATTNNKGPVLNETVECKINDDTYLKQHFDNDTTLYFKNGTAIDEIQFEKALNFAENYMKRQANTANAEAKSNSKNNESYTISINRESFSIKTGQKDRP